jgi:hypothetical protein
MDKTRFAPDHLDRYIDSPMCDFVDPAAGFCIPCFDKKCSEQIDAVLAIRETRKKQKASFSSSSSSGASRGNAIAIVPV